MGRFPGSAAGRSSLVAPPARTATSGGARENGVGARHASPKPGTGLFMAVVLFALLALLAAVAFPAVLAG
jgi:hypothetical protein